MNPEANAAMNLNMDLCQRVTRAHPFPLVFATVSGAHLYGFASPDSDYDLRGVHILPAKDVLSLQPLRETVESDGIVEGVEIDLVTHDLAKFCLMMLKRNGYVLEQLLSPIVVHSTPEFEELKSLAPSCLTRHHAHHYLGFAETQWNLFTKEDPPRVKPLLYVYRVLLTGIHLMRSGAINANLRELNMIERLSHVDDLIAQKIHEQEQSLLVGADLAFHTTEYLRLRRLLEEAQGRTSLPDEPSARAALSDLVVRIRLASVGA